LTKDTFYSRIIASIIRIESGFWFINYMIIDMIRFKGVKQNVKMLSSYLINNEIKKKIGMEKMIKKQKKLEMQITKVKKLVWKK